jgi:hypothetical protein
MNRYIFLQSLLKKNSVTLFYFSLGMKVRL